MKYGSLPRSIAWSLPAGAVEPTHTPDGLDEQAIDDLLDELDLLTPIPDDPRPAWMTSDRTKQRRERRQVRKIFRALPAAPSTPAEGEAA